MTFPTTGVLDAFTGTNGTDLPAYSASWSAMTGVTDCEIQGNAATGTVSGTNINVWNSATYGPKCEVFVTITTKPSDTETVSIALRGLGIGDIATVDGYLLQATPVAGTDTFDLYRSDDGILTQLGAAFSQEITAGDSFGLEADGSTLTVYYKAGAAAWVSLGSRNDATYGAAGNFLIVADTTVARLDNFGGGTLVPTLGFPDGGNSGGLARRQAVRPRLFGPGLAR